MPKNVRKRMRMLKDKSVEISGDELSEDVM